ncbi:hypothetical protein RRG08_046539 [Elysia crispata]|uniref:Uncharacterized protein n=1 Tax=Elysia crispata TaxID=231223 RepID=A0AAE1DB63_9GAST|nr:hypothetical protein RRG08_046539 [Elysia crispata]
MGTHNVDTGQKSFPRDIFSRWVVILNSTIRQQPQYNLYPDLTPSDHSTAAWHLEDDSSPSDIEDRLQLQHSTSPNLHPDCILT